MDEDKWEFPQEVDDITFAFPAYVVGTLIPLEEDLTEEQRKQIRGDAGRIFAGRIPTMYCYEGVDGETAWRHIGAVVRSYEPKSHQYKIAALNYLLSRWCAKVEFNESSEEE